jgi:hypothetical protein
MTNFGHFFGGVFMGLITGLCMFIGSCFKDRRRKKKDDVTKHATTSNEFPIARGDPPRMKRCKLWGARRHRGRFSLGAMSP